MKRKFHVRFCTGGRAGDCPTDRSGADRASREHASGACLCVVLVLVAFLVWLAAPLNHWPRGRLVSYCGNCCVNHCLFPGEGIIVSKCL